MSEPPDPIVPAGVDLRDFPFTPMFRSRLFGSSFHARVSDAGWRAGVTLWLKSWDQVPAGTLPDDEIDLCRLAELGRDMKAWKRVEKDALWGWFKCSDGRLYHKVVAEGVIEAWDRRTKAVRKGKAGATARWGPGNATTNSPGNSTGKTRANAAGNATATAQAMPGDSKGQGQGQGQGSVFQEENGRRAPISAVPIAATPDPDADLFRRGKQVLGQSAGGQIAKLKAHFDGSISKTRAAIETASDKQNPGEYIAAILKPRGPADPREMYDRGL